MDPYDTLRIAGFPKTAHLIAERSTDLVHWTVATDGQSLGDNRWRVTLPVDAAKTKNFLRLRAVWIETTLPPQMGVPRIR